MKKGNWPGIGKEVSLSYIVRGIRPGSHYDFGNGGGTGLLPDMSSSEVVGVSWRRRIWQIWIWKGSPLVNIRGELVCQGYGRQYHFREDVIDYCSKYK